MKRNHVITLAVLITVCFCPVAKSYSQSTISLDSIKSALVKDWERAKAYTQDYMKAMPANKYSFKANDSVRTFAQQLLHIAEAHKFFMTIATGGKVSMAGPGLEKTASAQSADSVMYYVNSSYDHVISTIKNISPGAMLQSQSFNMGQTVSSTGLGWIMKAFEHQTHHRGQATIYLRLAGVHPPQERLF